MCVRVRMCVCVCTSVCALGILPPPPPPTGGSDQPSDWFARPRPKAARPRAHADRADSPRPQHYFPRRAGRLGRDCGSARPAHAPQRPRRRKFGFGGSPSAILVGVAAAESSGSARDGTARSQNPRSPNFSSGEGSLREGDATAHESLPGAEEKGALTSARLMPAARGPARGSGSAAALSEVGGARSAGRGPCRRGGRR